jgi:hypothetical protein
MSIATLGATHAAQTVATNAARATSGQELFGVALRSSLGGQSTSAGGAAQTASLTEPARSTPSTQHHHSDRGHRDPSGAGASAATGRASGQTTAGAPSGTSGTNGTRGAGQQTPAGVLANNMMRDLQAYGAATALV